MTTPDSAVAPTIAPAQESSRDPTIHPFAKVRETNYLPPHERNFASLPAKVKDKDPPYQTQAPVQDPKLADEVYARTMKAPFVTLSPQELWSFPRITPEGSWIGTPKRACPRRSKEVLIHDDPYLFAVDDDDPSY
jgi:hypothetical protein